MRPAWWWLLSYWPNILSRTRHVGSPHAIFSVASGSARQIVRTCARGPASFFSGCATLEPPLFEFWWVRMPHDVPPLIAGHGDMLPALFKALALA